MDAFYPKHLKIQLVHTFLALPIELHSTKVRIPGDVVTDIGYLSTYYSLTCRMWKGVKHTVKMMSTVVSSWTARLLLSLGKKSSTIYLQGQQTLCISAYHMTLLPFYLLTSTLLKEIHP